MKCTHPFCPYNLENECINLSPHANPNRLCQEYVDYMMADVDMEAEKEKLRAMARAVRNENRGKGEGEA